MKRILSLLAAVAAVSVFAVLAVGAQAAPSPAQVERLPVAFTYENVCGTGAVIRVEGTEVFLLHTVFTPTGAPIVDFMHGALAATGIDEETGAKYRVTIVGANLEIGDQDTGTNWTTTQVLRLQFTPLGPGTPLFVSAVQHVTYIDGDFVVDFTNVTGDEECVPAG